MTTRFALASARRHRIVRRNLSAIGLGAALFLGSALASRVRPGSWLLLLGAAGALLIVLSARRLIVAARPIAVGESAVWFGTRAIPLGQVEAVEVQGERLVVIHRGGRQEEELAQPREAAAEIARRAGLRPPRQGGAQRWERRAAAQEAT